MGPLEPEAKMCKMGWGAAVFMLLMAPQTLSNCLDRASLLKKEVARPGESQGQET